MCLPKIVKMFAKRDSVWYSYFVRTATCASTSTQIISMYQISKISSIILMQQQSHLLETSKSYKRTKSIAARFRPIYVCVDCLPFPISFIRTKTEFDSQNWPWKSNEDRLVTMCCIFCYLILVHPLIDLYCLHSSEWGIVCVTSSAFYENEFDNDYHNFFDFSDPK